jgi:hypothetical protein
VKKPFKLAKVQSDVNTRIRERLTDADVEMAYPHRHLVFDDTSGVARVGGPEDGRPPGERAGDKPDDAGIRGGRTVDDSPVAGSSVAGSSVDDSSVDDSSVAGSPTGDSSTADSRADGSESGDSDIEGLTGESAGRDAPTGGDGN